MKVTWLGNSQQSPLTHTHSHHGSSGSPNRTGNKTETSHSKNSSPGINSHNSGHGATGCSTASKNLAIAKALFFCTSMSTVGWTRFQNNFYLEQGLSSSQIGVLKGFGLLCKFLCEPLLCFLADIYNAKIVFLVTIVMQILTMEMMRIIQPLTFMVLMVIKLLRASTAPSSTLTTMASFKLTEGTSQGFGQQRVFGSLAWGIGAFLAGVLIDSYGMIGLFYYTYIFNLVSFGFVLFGLPSKFSSKSTTVFHVHDKKSIALVGEQPIIDDDSDVDHSGLDDRLGISNKRSNSLSNISQIELNRLSKDEINSNKVINTNNTTNNSVNNSSNSTHMNTFEAHFYKQFQNLMKFLNDRQCKVLLMNAFFHGIVMTVPETYLFISLETDFQSSRTFSGLCTSTSIIACLPLFWYSDKLINEFGHGKLLSFAQWTTALRLLLFALVPFQGGPFSYGMILSIQTLHGFNFALYWSSAVDLIYKISPMELRTSCMSTLNIVYFTLAAACGNFTWGYIYDLFDGIHYVYILSAILAVINCQLFRIIDSNNINNKHPFGFLHSLEDEVSV